MKSTRAMPRRAPSARSSASPRRSTSTATRRPSARSVSTKAPAGARAAGSYPNSVSGPAFSGADPCRRSAAMARFTPSENPVAGSGRPNSATTLSYRPPDSTGNPMP